MKYIITIFIFITFNSFSQNLKEFEKKSWENLTEKESELFEKYDETYNSMWDVEGGGCSWYCSAGDYTVNSSSTFKRSDNNGKRKMRWKNNECTTQRMSN